VFHLSIGAAAAVSIACGLLLIPLPSTLPCLRQLIPRLSRGRWLLRQSLSSLASGGHLLRGPRRPRRASEELLRSWASFVVEVRVSLFAGVLWRCTLDQAKNCPALEGRPSCFPMSILDQADNPRRLVSHNDDSSVSSSAYPYSTLLGGIRCWVHRDRRSLPLHQFEGQSLRWGVCLTRASRGEELHLYDPQVIKDLFDLSPSSLTHRVISRERIAASPCARLSRAPWWDVTSTTTTMTP
jgi:hypothetical protein